MGKQHNGKGKKKKETKNLSDRITFNNFLVVATPLLSGLRQYMVGFDTSNPNLKGLTEALMIMYSTLNAMLVSSAINLHKNNKKLENDSDDLAKILPLFTSYINCAELLSGVKEEHEKERVKTSDLLDEQDEASETNTQLVKRATAIAIYFIVPYVLAWVSAKHDDENEQGYLLSSIVTACIGATLAASQFFPIEEQIEETSRINEDVCGARCYPKGVFATFKGVVKERVNNGVSSAQVEELGESSTQRGANSKQTEHAAGEDIVAITLAQMTGDDNQANAQKIQGAIDAAEQKIPASRRDRIASKGAKDLEAGGSSSRRGRKLFHGNDTMPPNYKPPSPPKNGESGNNEANELKPIEKGKGSMRNNR